jgi:hypothetical protein
MPKRLADKAFSSLTPMYAAKITDEINVPKNAHGHAPCIAKWQFKMTLGVTHQ